jgi:hypothetical protein
MMIMCGDCFLLFPGILRKRKIRRKGEREEKVGRKEKAVGRGQEPNPKVERALGNHVRS